MLRDREFICLRLKRSLAVIKQDVLPHAKGKGVHVIILECSAGKGKALVAVLRKKGSSNLTEDGSKEGRYLPPHLQVNRHIIRDVALLKVEALSC